VRSWRCFDVDATRFRLPLMILLCVVFYWFRPSSWVWVIVC